MKEEEEEMEGSDEVLLGFNKRRAEGRDKKPKNLQLKTRKLNPVNTICYVQVIFYQLSAKKGRFSNGVLGIVAFMVFCFTPAVVCYLEF